MPNDRVEAEGCHPSHQPGKGPHVQKEKNRLQVLNVLNNSCIFETHIIQGLWWSTEPQGGAGEDRESFPDLDFNLFMCKGYNYYKGESFPNRGAEDCHEGSQGAGKELRTSQEFSFKRTGRSLKDNFASNLGTN